MGWVQIRYFFSKRVVSTQVPCESFGALIQHMKIHEVHKPKKYPSEKLDMDMKQHSLCTLMLFLWCTFLQAFTCQNSGRNWSEKHIWSIDRLSFYKDNPRILQPHTKTLAFQNSCHISHIINKSFSSSLCLTLVFCWENGDFWATWLWQLRTSLLWGSQTHAVIESDPRCCLFPGGYVLLGCNRYTHTLGPGKIQLPVKLTP